MREKNKCTGCLGCVQICPRQLIHASYDIHGFMYPECEQDAKCINCRLCSHVCNRAPIESSQSVKAYAAWAKDKSIVISSSSGGLFQLIARKVLSNGGVVFGAAFNEDFKVIHKSIHSVEGLPALLGSKYVQSDVGNTYLEAKKHLLAGKLVLYSGVPCQLAGLHNFLGEELAVSNNLIRVDLLCMGSPSPGEWREYIEHIRKKERKWGRLESVIFRDYKGGDWRGVQFKFKFKFKFKEKVTSGQSDPYFRSFLKGYTLRPSCYDCEFKQIYRYWSDISLGDFWEIEKVFKDFVNDSGTSLALFHGNHGKKVFAQIEEDLVYRNVEISAELNAGFTSKSKPKNYDKFWSDYEEFGFIKAVYRNLYTFMSVTRALIGQVLRTLGLFDFVKSCFKL